MVNYEEGFPKRELTFQYQPLTQFGESDNTPQVAGGTEVKLFCESIKEIFQKKPMTQSIQKGPSSHYEGDKTLISDTLDAKHTFEITAWVYSDKQGKHSLDSSIVDPSNSSEAQIPTYRIQADEGGKFIPLGDTGIKHGSEEIVAVDVDGGDADRTLDRGVNADYEMNYSRGEIKFNKSALDTNGGPINTEEVTTTFLGFSTTRIVINDEFKVNYTIDAGANNIARLVRRMSQLGNPFVMRLDEQDISLDSDSEEHLDSRDYLVIPKKVQLVSKSEKPDEYKLELELRKGTIEQ